MPSTWTQSLGRWGEELAAGFLKDNGYTIIAQNLHIGHAEVDLIAQKNEELVFVEVKTRSNHHLGRPEDAVDEHKLTHLIEAAQRYSLEEKIDMPWRIDVIAITGSPTSHKQPEFQWYENVAF